MKNRPRLVIAAPHSGSGKTTITLSVMKLLVDEGYEVQGFKVGPDYIDTSYYQGITSRPGRNLDTWMTSVQLMKEFFQRGSDKVDISVVEGVMGLFDGYSGNDDRGSTAQIAKELKAPVIMVVDAKSQARSVAALLHGFYHFDPEVNLKGVIFNKVGSERHFTYLKEAILSTGLPIEVIGYFPREKGLVLPERHLGLVPYVEYQENKDLENQEMKNYFKTLSKIADDYLDKEKLIRIAKSTSPWQEVGPDFFRSGINTSKTIPVALAFDKAFSFYYQENLEWLRQQGIELIPVSPLNDNKLPDEIKSFYIGGGFPELFAGKLSKNKSFIKSVKEFADKGLPVLAECGGLMYLCEELVDLQGKGYELVGLIPAEVKMKEELKALGYREGKAMGDSFFLQKGEKVRGHEFRYSEMHPRTGYFPWAYELSGRFGTRKEGFMKDNILASYFHVHLGSNLEAGKRWINNLK